MFLLDTDVLSASRRADKVAPNLASWIARNSPRSMFLSAVSSLEVEIGVLRLSRRDPARGAELKSWLCDRVMVSFEGRIIPFDELTALLCAPLHVSRTPPERNAMIAATALEHRLTVVTRNIREFAPMGVPLLNPWDP